MQKRKEETPLYFFFLKEKKLIKESNLVQWTNEGREIKKFISSNQICILERTNYYSSYYLSSKSKEKSVIENWFWEQQQQQQKERRKEKRKNDMYNIYSYIFIV